MNTTTTLLRLTAAASVVALAVTLAGCANAEQASAVGESRAHVASQVVVTPAMHRALVRSAADRYVNELLVRARMAAQPLATTAGSYPDQAERRRSIEDGDRPASPYRDLAERRFMPIGH